MLGRYAPLEKIFVYRDANIEPCCRLKSGPGLNAACHIWASASLRLSLNNGNQTFGAEIYYLQSISLLNIDTCVLGACDGNAMLFEMTKCYG